MVAFWLFPSAIMHGCILAACAISQRSRTRSLLLIFRYVLVPGRTLAARAILQRLLFRSVLEFVFSVEGIHNPKHLRVREGYSQNMVGDSFNRGTIARSNTYAGEFITPRNQQIDMQ